MIPMYDSMNSWDDELFDDASGEGPQLLIAISTVQLMFKYHTKPKSITRPGEIIHHREGVFNINNNNDKVDGAAPFYGE
eukprot:scaffold34619_cov183-Amphora_coffeaeformis.AAC.6